MGWRERGASFRQWPRVAVVLAAAALCAGCFQPLYGDVTTALDRPGLRASLSSINVAQIAAAANTAEARLAVQIRNDLLFNFTGGGAGQSPTHELIVRISGGRRGATLISGPNPTKVPPLP